MKPKKTLIDAATANGSMERLNKLLSAAHLLHCEVSDLVGEASDLMTDNGLLIGELKKLHNDFIRASDRYFREFQTLVVTDKSKTAMFSDLDEFNEMFREWAKVPAGWHPRILDENK